MLAAHADWSADARKRWLAVARLDGDEWVVSAPRPAGDPSTLLARLCAEAQGAAVAFGVDFPLGLPRGFVARHLATHAGFPSFLRTLSAQPDFLRVCATLEEIDARRPFYPMRGIAGMTRAAHASALGLADASGLSRACDRATAERPAGAPLFWTLGANQSGKAAIAAWRDMLLPALASPSPPRLWPFDGSFLRLLAPGAVALAETYPAEALRQLGLRMPGSKRRHADRVALAPALHEAMAALNAHPAQTLSAAMADGFGADAAGEDRLDCVLGVLCVIGVLQGRRPDTAPDDPWIRHWEGWVLGQTALPLRLPDPLPWPCQDNKSSAARDSACTP